MSPGGDLPTSIMITPSAETLSVGGTAQLTASAHDGHGVPITKPPVWTTSNAAVATVAASGFTAAVTGVGPGQAQITAAFGTATGTIDVTVLAGPVGNHDIAIASAQMTQGVQDSAGSIPMVLGGSPAVVNVFMRATPASATPMRVVLRLIDAGGTVVYSDTASTSGTIPPTPSAVTPTVQFLVPAAQLAAGLHWQVARDPAGLVPDDTAADDVYPREGPASLAVADVPPLTIRFVPIVLGANGGASALITPADFPDYLRTLKSVHPLGAVSAHVGASFTTSTSFGAPPSGGDQAFWVALVSQLDLARIADPVEPDVNWFGVVLPPAGFTFTSVGGFSYIPTNGASTGPNTRTSTAVGP
ncbi:MAG TPA: hypothetical protein VN651_07825, partial [Gemmatimonadaceae bacterium]|nr:hypothetical protein [Gemmatimonadaceae bacterium]